MRADARTTVGRASITALGFGCVGIGGLYSRVEEAAAFAALDAAVARGVAYFDTAPVYGLGLAESRLGRFLSTCPEGEPQVTVSTKVGRLLRPVGTGSDVDLVAPTFFAGDTHLQPVFDYSYDGTLRSIEESVERLSRPKLDIVFIHDPDEHLTQALDGAYRALDRLRAEGIVGAIGVGATNVDTLNWFARRGRFDCLLVAGRYTLLDQSALNELLPFCAAEEIGVIVGGAFNSGILADPWHRPMFDYLPADDSVAARARRMAALAAECGVSLAAAALQFAFGHPSVRAVLMGPKSPREVEQNVAWFEERIPVELWHELERTRLLPPDVPVPHAVPD